jgi:hypothetical protein
MIFPQLAAAAYINHGAHLCNRETFGGQFYFGIGPLYNPNVASATNYLCPIVEDEERMYENMTMLKAYVDDRSPVTGNEGRIRVAACINFYFATGGACGGIAQTSSTGMGGSELDVDITALNSAALYDYAHLWVRLPYKQPTDYSKLSGFTSWY